MYTKALKGVHDLNKTAEHVKNYRPQLLVLSGPPNARPPLLDFVNLITKSSSLLVVGNIVKVLAAMVPFLRLLLLWA